MTENPKRHNILFMEAGSGRGGSSMFLYYFLKYLDRKKFQPFVAFYFHNSGPDTARIKGLGIPVFFLNNRREPSEYVPVGWLFVKSESTLSNGIKVILRFLLQMVMMEMPTAWRLLWLIKRKSIDLVVFNNDVHYHIAGTFAAKIGGVTCICRKAGGIGEGRRLKKVLTPCIDLFIAISKATAEDQLRNNPSTKRLVTIYEGVDLKMFNPEVQNRDKKKELGIPSDKKVVGNISRFDKGKGQIELLEAAALIVKKYSEVVFLMVGDGELMEELQLKTNKLSLNDYVLFTGWRIDIPEILSVVDVFVHCPTTWIEALGIATLEAMAMGKPCVVSDNGGLPDVILDGVTGFVVPPGDIEKMADAVLRLLEDEGLVTKFGRNARKRVEDEFDIEKNSKKLEALFLEYS
jgi:glycosyltransferase involved in cell wall biosynthesis